MKNISKLFYFRALDQFKNVDGKKLLSLKRTELISAFGKVEGARLDGQLQIVDTKLPIGGNILLDDFSGRHGVFSPIDVIHHSGEVVQNTTRGHYQADVLHQSSNSWFRTSDDEPPAEITEADLTDRGYIFLYKKK